MLKMSALPNVPRWVVLAAHAVPLVTLPSGLWRIALVAGVPLLPRAVPDWGEGLYIVMLSVVAECLALLTLGLVRLWGEVVPRWIPLIGGRRVRPGAAVVPALLGAAGLTVLCAWSFYAQFAGLGDGLDGSALQDAVLVVCYVPLLAWAPLLVAVTLAYRRRRTTA
ncbi:hypothetical protein [Streptomyces sp. NBC_01481]|uniref:hypothetical protein n=1 Tax=Streptomyces sp. NBC_01481 TaxID=2975869 RepID=UPI002B1CCF96|nr:hypothetical protein [Streptomyces sp. NBC_01481]